MEFDEIIKIVIAHEGGYVNDELDLGGETKYGITKRWYPNVDIKNLTMDNAIDIYYRDYWQPSKAQNLPEEIKPTYLDMCINMGKKQAVIVLQQAINSVKRKKIAVDGYIGPITIQYANKVSKRRLQAYRCKFYANVVQDKPKQERFYYGWFKRAINT